MCSGMDSELEVGSEDIMCKLTRKLRCKEKVQEQRSLGWKEQSGALCKSERGLGMFIS